VSANIRSISGTHDCGSERSAEDSHDSSQNEYGSLLSRLSSLLSSNSSSSSSSSSSLSPPIQNDILSLFVAIYLLTKTRLYIGEDVLNNILLQRYLCFPLKRRDSQVPWKFLMEASQVNLRICSSEWPLSKQSRDNGECNCRSRLGRSSK